MKRVELIECPRDAMQGLKGFIPTSQKINYINALLKVGFDVIDFGSFVSPKAIPQLKDTTEVIKGLDLSDTNSKLLAIIANERGANDALEFDEVDILGFPFSVSEEFQLRNTNSTREEALVKVASINNTCVIKNKALRVYLSMGFGNPYGEAYAPELVLDWAQKLSELGVKELALSDTTGVSTPDTIQPLFQLLTKELPNVKFSAHFHSSPSKWKEKLKSAQESGCNRFDSAMKGFGGCPMAKDELVGNLATENLIDFFAATLPKQFDKTAFDAALKIANTIFG